MLRICFTISLALLSVTLIFGAPKCNQGAYGDQCVIYTRKAFGNDYKKMPALCGINKDCGAYNAWGVWNHGFGSGQIPQVNSIFVMAKQKGLPYGHIGVVHSVTKNLDGTYNFIAYESNWKLDERQTCDGSYLFDPSKGTVSRNGGSAKEILGFVYTQRASVAEPVRSGPVNPNSTTKPSNGGLNALFGMPKPRKGRLLKTRPKQQPRNYYITKDSSKGASAPHGKNGEKNGPLLKMEAKKKKGHLYFRVSKLDGKPWISSGFLHLQAGSGHESGAKYKSQYLQKGQTRSHWFKVKSTELDTKPRKTFPKAMYIRYVSESGFWTYTGPVVIYLKGQKSSANQLASQKQSEDQNYREDSQKPKSLSPKIHEAAKAALHESSAKGPDGGNLACAWMVNKILKRSINMTVNGDSTSNMDREFQGLVATGKVVQIPLNEAEPGDVVLSPTVWSPKKSVGHVGIVGENQEIFSNSSSRAKWEQNFSYESWNRYYNTKKGLKVNVYRIIE